MSLDDAGGGRRGTRATSSTALVRQIGDRWAITPSNAPIDLGGSANLNLLIESDGTRHVARVYRPHVTEERLDALQTVRRHLAANGVPCVEPIPTPSGEHWSRIDDRLVELEPFVDAPQGMDTLPRVRRALPLLGRIHSLLRPLDLPTAASTASFANYVPANDLADAVATGTRRIRSWGPNDRERRGADAADALAEVATASAGDPQLVHGDFWDNNVRFRGDDVALVADLDFMNARPRIDDLAPTLYFTSIDIVDLAADRTLLDSLVADYEARLDVPLSDDERAAIPAAMARQPLWSIAVWVALLDDVDLARRHLAGTFDALDWATRLARSFTR